MPDVRALHLEAASTLAVIASSGAPLLYLDEDLTIIAASTSFLLAFGVAPEGASGRRLAEVGNGEWNVPQLKALLKATAIGLASIEAYEMDLVRFGQMNRRLVINAHKLDYGDHDNVRLLLGVTDVTDARATEAANQALLREKAMLLLEVQHRIANSLQIIASILMQSARRVQSDEARGQLKSAHHRVLSIAAVQRQLVTTDLDRVAVKPYLVRLSESLGASMILDREALAIHVEADDSVIGADESVSIGLLVTELVINALKHAFPDQRCGAINVAYRSGPSGWSLSVSDDGVGMPSGGTALKAGLGTSIVEALCRQLQATVTLSNADPGTNITISHASPSPLEAQAPL